MVKQTPEESAEAADDFQRRAAKYPPVAHLLRAMYGRPTWEPSSSALDELVNCILSQNTNDTNRDRAFDALRARFPTWDEVLNAPTYQVIEAIKPAGLSNLKGPRIQAALRRIYQERGQLSIEFLNEQPLDEARAWLTSFEGVGPKTAAIVLCFAFNRPAFPVDTHIHRVSQRIGFVPEGISAEKAHPAMEALVPPEDYYAFHINLITHGREICQARRPRCELCPLTAYCDYYQKFLGDKNND